MLRFEEAIAKIILLGAPALPAEAAPLEDCDGRILAEDVTSQVDLPPFDYSAMDGYAVSAADLASVPGAASAASRALPVRGESRTGAVPVPSELARLTTMRIFTGAQLPIGADAVVMQEKVRREGDLATFEAAPSPGQNVRRRGEDLRSGAVALERGTRLRPGHLSLAAALDRATLPVARRPEVAILATGDELRPPGTPGPLGSIPESNTVVLRAIARRAGARAHALPAVRDDRAATERAFADALASADVLVTIGGVSVGDHDLVRPALEAVGVELDFWRVAIKPGKPLAVGRFRRACGSDPSARETIVLGLPGNPSSAMVTFLLFGVPLLRAMQGDPRPFPPARRARMTRAHRHEPGRTEFARALVEDGASSATVTTLGNQASGAVTSMADANALVVIPAEANDIEAGAEVDVLSFDDLGA